MADQAEALKSQGNAAFAQKKWEEAVDFFSQAIALAPTNHVYYSNRSGAFAANSKYDDALADANKTIELKPDWAKGYSRKGTALAFMGRTDEALQTYKEGLEKCPNDPALTKAMDDLIRQQMEAQMDPMAKFNHALQSGAVWQIIANNPQLSRHMADPTFVNNVQTLQKDPSKLNEMLQDPRMIGLLGALMGVNVQSAPDDATYSESDSAAEASRDASDMQKDEPEPEPQPNSEPMELCEEEMAKEEAEKEKEAGNAAYRAKDFEVALQHYRKAQELNPCNMLYCLNEAAVHFESKDMEKCRELCKKAIDVGKENRADFSQMAKAYARIGNSYFKENNYEEAILWYQKSLTEHRVKDVLAQLNKAEKMANEAKVAAYINPEEAAKEKAKGNEFFKNNDFPAAVKAYTEAIRRNPDDHVLYSNRAAAYMKLGEFPTALLDCEKCIAMAPTFIKGHTRKANCLVFLKEFSKALEMYEAVLKLDPGNKEAEEGIQRTLVAMQQRQENMSKEQILEEAMKDPEVQEIMADPVMRQILSQMQSDPAAVREHLRNPVVAKKIEKLMTSGVIRVG